MKRLIVIALFILVAVALIGVESYKDCFFIALLQDWSIRDGYDHGMVAEISDGIIIVAYPITSLIIFYTRPDEIALLWDEIFRPEGEIMYMITISNKTNELLFFKKKDFTINGLPIKYMLDHNVDINEGLEECDKDFFIVEPYESLCYSLIGYAIDETSEQYLVSNLKYKDHKFDMEVSNGYDYLVSQAALFFLKVME